MHRLLKLWAATSLAFCLLAVADPARAAFDITFDPTALTRQGSVIAFVAVLSSGAPTTLSLEPGSYTFKNGQTSFPFQVTVGGTVDYDLSFDGFLAGRGTDTLVVIGFGVTVDASALTRAGASLFDTGSLDPGVATLFTLIPGTYGFKNGQPNFHFQVTADGTVEYNVGLDGFLTGRGTDTLIVIGFDVTVDATALTRLASSLFDTGSLTPGVPTLFTLIPGTYGFKNGDPNFHFQVTADGTVDYGVGFDGFLTGRGTITLVVDGYGLTIDARALSPQATSIFNIVAFQADTVTTLRLIPSTYQFKGGTDRFVFNLDIDGLAQDLPPLFRGFPVSGNGTDSITIGSVDSDGDGVPDDEDTCPGGDDRIDFDDDGVPDACDECPLDPANDSDGDGVCDSDDLCLGDDATGDADGDELCDDMDPCLGASNSDVDGDGVCDEGDLCFGDDASGNADGDGVCDDLDACDGDDATGDTDGDLFCDDIDVCPLDPENDADADGICESDDNCPFVANANQDDQDGDLVGDVCDPDIDGDGVPNDTDNCVFDANPDQNDMDGDSAGDLCDDDLDGDHVLDANDACAFTPLGEVVNADGCAISELCPCSHPDGMSRWKNHGAYVSCVAHTTRDFVAAGLLTELAKDGIQSAAGQSSCGHKNR